MSAGEESASRSASVARGGLLVCDSTPEDPLRLHHLWSLREDTAVGWDEEGQAPVLSGPQGTERIEAPTTVPVGRTERFALARVPSQRRVRLRPNVTITVQGNAFLLDCRVLEHRVQIHAPRRCGWCPCWPGPRHRTRWSKWLRCPPN